MIGSIVVARRVVPGALRLFVGSAGAAVWSIPVLCTGSSIATARRVFCGTAKAANTLLVMAFILHWVRHLRRALKNVVVFVF